MNKLLHKVWQVNELTVCLDQRNEDGKIEVYQDPLLYQCSLAITTRMFGDKTGLNQPQVQVNTHCPEMAFSLTDRQHDLAFLIADGLAESSPVEADPPSTSQKSLAPATSPVPQTRPPRPAISDEEPRQTVYVPSQPAAGDQTWAGWAWSFVATPESQAAEDGSGPAAGLGPLQVSEVIQRDDVEEYSTAGKRTSFGLHIQLFSLTLSKGNLKESTKTPLLFSPFFLFFTHYFLSLSLSIFP